MELEHLVTIAVWVAIITFIIWGLDHLHLHPTTARAIKLLGFGVVITFLLYIVLIYLPGLSPSGWHR